MFRTVEIDRKQEVERGGMIRRIRSLGSGFEPGSPATTTIASTHGAGALPAELCSTPTKYLSISIKTAVVSANFLSWHVFY